MNKTLVYCDILRIDASYFMTWQSITLTVINVIIMVGNIIANSLVIYILIKTKQLSFAPCKLIFMLSLSDLLTGVLAQNLLFAVINGSSCFINLISRVTSIFFTNVSGYTIAIMGIDRFIRIKFSTNVKGIVTTKFILTSISVIFLAALINAGAVAVGILLKKEPIFTRISFTLGFTVVSTVTLLQLLVIRTSNTVHGGFTFNLSQTVNKRINQLSMRIMLLLFFFSLPYLIVMGTRGVSYNQLNENVKAILEFIEALSVLFAYTNCIANAIMFMTMNVTARRFLRNFVK